jgi:hypothetical protein
MALEQARRSASILDVYALGEGLLSAIPKIGHARASSFEKNSVSVLDRVISLTVTICGYRLCFLLIFRHCSAKRNLPCSQDDLVLFMMSAVVATTVARYHSISGKT